MQVAWESICVYAPGLPARPPAGCRLGCRPGPQPKEHPMTACIVGWSHGKFGKLDGETSESLIVKAASEAIAHAGVEPKDIDVIYVGNMNGGFVRQEFHSSLPLQAHPDLRFKPATRVENACATGSAAIHMGLNTIAAGKARLVLVVGVEKMTEASGAEVNDLLLRASYRKEEDRIEGGFAGIFGQIAQKYFQRYGDQSDALEDAGEAA